MSYIMDHSVYTLLGKNLNKLGLTVNWIYLIDISWTFKQNHQPLNLKFQWLYVWLH